MIFLLLFGIGLPPAGAGANTPFTEKLQSQLSQAIHRNISKHLRQAFQRYNETTSDQSELSSSAKKLGLKGQDLNQLQTYIRSLKQSLPKATFEADEIKVEEGGNRISIGAIEFWTHAIRINGTVFRWNWEKTVSENLVQYNALFLPKANGNSRIRLPQMFESAWADDLFRMRVAGLQLYFIVTATGQKDEGLYRLNSQVKALTAACEAPEPTPGEDDPFLRAVLQGTGRAQNLEASILLRNCASIQSYAEKPVGKFEGLPYFPKIPKDLCENLNRLANCTRQQMGAPAVSDSDKKEEWHEPKVQDSSIHSGESKANSAH